jgi:flagellar biosynthesis/type III secretory pathway chaperone
MMSRATGTRMAALLDVLDEDIRHLEYTLARLDTLRALLIKKEDAALQRLLEEVRRRAEIYQANEQKRQQLRRDLAADLECPPGEVTLSRLAAELSGSTRLEGGRHYGAAVAERQTRLRSLAARLKREYTLTVVLVRDCVRFNHSLLDIFLGSSGRGTTYSPTGAARSAPGAALMNMKL